MPSTICCNVWMRCSANFMNCAVSCGYFNDRGFILCFGDYNTAFSFPKKKGDKRVLSRQKAIKMLP